MGLTRKEGGMEGKKLGKQQLWACLSLKAQVVSLSANSPSLNDIFTKVWGVLRSVIKLGLIVS